MRAKGNLCNCPNSSNYSGRGSYKSQINEKETNSLLNGDDKNDYLGQGEAS